MFEFQGIPFNAKKYFYINFQKYDSIFCKEIICTINGEGHGWWYFLPKRVWATSNKCFPILDRYSGLICQHSLANILNLSQRFVKSLHQPMKPHGIVGQFPNKHKGNKESYDSIDTFIHKLKEDIGETISTRYVREITGMTTRDDNDNKVFLPHHTSNHQYYSQ